MIGKKVKSSGIKPKSSSFSCIKKGDIIIYYAAKAYVVTGIFQVSSSMKFLETDNYWKDAVAFKIKHYQMPPKGTYLDFKKLVQDPELKLDLFPNRSIWGSYLIGKSFIPLSDNDYETIASAITTSKYLKAIK